MRYYLIDEISFSDIEKASQYLCENGVTSSLDKIFWIMFPDGYLNEIQADHRSCRPYYFAVEVGAGTIRAEFFVRTLKAMGCSCNDYSDQKQSGFIIGFMDRMIKELHIRS